MKKTMLICGCLWLISWLSLAEIPGKCHKPLLDTFTPGKVLVLKVGGIPTMVQNLPGNVGIKSFCRIIVKPDGKWKIHSVFGSRSDSTNVLEQGEILIVDQLEINRKNIEIKMHTDRALHYDASGRSSLFGSSKSSGADIHANMFEFKFEDVEACDQIFSRIAEFFDIFNSKDEINKPKEIKIGMTFEEVEAALGQPLKKADLGADKIIYKYDDTVVTFEAGKVTLIEFK